MNLDRTDAASIVIAMSVHLFFILVFSGVIIKPSPRQAALITDVTLIDVKDSRGETGIEDETIGPAKEQENLATALKEKKTKKDSAEEEKEGPDVKKLLADIEKEKAKLDMGISREELRESSAEQPVSEGGEAGEFAEEQEVVAGSEPAISGEVASRKYKKFDWKFPKVLPEETELMIEITVLSSGIIKNVKLVRTSGYPSLDRMALSQARKMQFEPLRVSNEEQQGVLLFKFGAQK